MFSEGSMGAVTLSATDRLCLNGQKLVLVSGTYGTAGSVYRTEQDSFAKVVAVGAAGGNAANGPESFQVYSKQGTIASYGATAGSRMEANGRTVVMHWALSSESDKFGNTVTYDYLKSQDGGLEWNLSQINYANRSVQFLYEARPDITTGYTAGTRYRESQRLRAIETRIGGAVIHRYSMHYSTASNASRSLLAAVQQCDGSNQCLAPASFEWTSVGSDAFTGVSPDATSAMPAVADFNGDGRMDMAQYTGEGDVWRICLSTGRGFGCIRTVGPDLTVAGSTLVAVGDVNGDGRAELIGHEDPAVHHVRFCSPAATGYMGCTNVATGSSAWDDTAYKVVQGDFDGDGLHDFIQVIYNRYHVCRGVGGGTLSCAVGYNLNHSTTRYNSEGDYDGDGRTDIAAWTGSAWRVCLSRFASGVGNFDCRDWPAVAAGAIEAKSFVGDMNGDGLSDIVRSVGSATWRVCLSNGTNAFDCVDWAGHGGGPTNNETGDFNGDGLLDFAGYTGSNGVWHVCLSRRSSFLCAMWSGGHGGGTSNRLTADFDGDGLDDLAGFTGSGYRWHMTYSLADHMPRLSRITTGGNVVNMQYVGMSTTASAGVYTKGTTGAYPIGDLQMPMWLVNSTSQSNGVGGFNTSRYSYGELKVEHASGPGRGKGNLGFRWRRVVEEATGLETYTEYSQSGPYVGQTLLSETRRAGSGNGGLLRRTVTSYGCYQTQGSTATAGCPANATGLVYFVFPQTVTESSWDLNGAVMPVLVTTNSFQGTAELGGTVRQFGDATSIQSDILQGGVLRQRKLTVNEFHPARTGGTDWQLGRLRRATVTSSQY